MCARSNSMAKYALAVVILLFLLTSPALATSYYLATAAAGGSDSNQGTSPSTPWLTAYHALNCGDVIVAAPSPAYVAANFANGKWGTVACPGGNNVAWLKCATFDGCKISVTTISPYANGMLVDQSYWGVQGWEITTSSRSGVCFMAYPYSGTSTIHHIIFANDICNGAGQGGFGSAENGSRGVDYFAVVGNIAYNSVSGSNNCTSGINAYEPVASDTLPGTHYYFAGNFAWNNVEGPCNGGATTDGQGLFFDTFDGNQTGMAPYTQQAVIDNNIAVFNGGRGIQAYENQAGSAHAAIYVRHNTVYGNNTDTHQENLGSCGEIALDKSLASQVFLNIAVATSVTGCAGNSIYAYYVNKGDVTDLVYSSYGYSAPGNNFGSTGSIGFSFGADNNFGTSPNFANPVNPGVPNCTSASSVANCMSTVVANFAPTNISASAYGYQKPIPTQTFDPLFPLWLCNVSLPAGLVTMGCLAKSSLPMTPTINGVKVQ